MILFFYTLTMKLNYIFQKGGINVRILFSLLGIFVFSLVSLGAATKISTTLAHESTVVPITPELRKKYPIKPHHAKLSLDCIHCHDGQGTDPEKFETIGDEGCLACHGSKQKVALRTGFMDSFHTNPHNSFHDGLKYHCDDCHQVHQPSKNSCLECHEKELPNWMKKVTP
jgi:hypothetical protein